MTPTPPPALTEEVLAMYAEKVATSRAGRGSGIGVTLDDAESLLAAARRAAALEAFFVSADVQLGAWCVANPRGWFEITDCAASGDRWTARKYGDPDPLWSVNLFGRTGANVGDGEGQTRDEATLDALARHKKGKR